MTPVVRSEISSYGPKNNYNNIKYSNCENDNIMLIMLKYITIIHNIINIRLSDCAALINAKTDTHNIPSI